MHFYPTFFAFFQGKGTMKTYWLLGREPTESAHARCPFGSILLEELSKVKANEEVFAPKVNNVNESLDYPELRSLYSPVSFEDVKRTKSTCTTPHSSPAKRSNLHPDNYSNAREEHGTVNNNQDTFNHRNDLDTSKEVNVIKNRFQRDGGDRHKIHFSKDYNDPSRSCKIL